MTEGGEYLDVTALRDAVPRSDVEDDGQGDPSDDGDAEEEYPEGSQLQRGPDDGERQPRDEDGGHP